MCQQADGEPDKSLNPWYLPTAPTFSSSSSCVLMTLDPLSAAMETRPYSITTSTWPHSPTHPLPFHPKPPCHPQAKTSYEALIYRPSQLVFMAEINLWPQGCLWAVSSLHGSETGSTARGNMGQYVLQIAHCIWNAAIASHGVPLSPLFIWYSYLPWGAGVTWCALWCRHRG